MIKKHLLLATVFFSFFHAVDLTALDLTAGMCFSESQCSGSESCIDGVCTGGGVEVYPEYYYEILPPSIFLEEGDVARKSSLTITWWPEGSLLMPTESAPHGLKVEEIIYGVMKEPIVVKTLFNKIVRTYETGGRMPGVETVSNLENFKTYLISLAVCEGLYVDDYGDTQCRARLTVTKTFRTQFYLIKPSSRKN